MLPLEKLLPKLQEGDLVHLVTENNSRILGFYYKDEEIDFHDSNEEEQIRIGIDVRLPSPKLFNMANPDGVEPKGQDYCLELLLPNLYLTLSNGIYQIGDSHGIKEGRILNPSKFYHLPEERADLGRTMEDICRDILSNIYRITLPGDDNYVVANIVSLGASDAHLLLSPISGWGEFPLYVELSEDSDHEGTLCVPERSLFLTEPDQDKGKPLVTSFKKIPVINIEYYVE